ncbi:MAG: class I SAM-dependent methyltransferase [Ilumatobacteraceae bacterium]|nr:class I SAM-dependent methyltransferase [Ilumatobacteraceae bacterium]
MPEPRSLEDVLGTAQRLGTLGALPIPDVIAHSRQFVDALIGITGSVMDIGTGAGVPGLIIAVDRPDLTLVLTDRREARMDALARGVTAMGIRDRVKVLTADVAALGQNPEHAAKYDAVVCRGFASPEVTATLARPLLKNGGTLIVSEPPVLDPSRWPADLLNRLGFDPPEYRPGVVCLTANP